MKEDARFMEAYLRAISNKQHVWSIIEPSEVRARLQQTEKKTELLTFIFLNTILTTHLSCKY